MLKFPRFIHLQVCIICLHILFRLSMTSAGISSSAMLEQVSGKRNTLFTESLYARSKIECCMFCSLDTTCYCFSFNSVDQICQKGDSFIEASTFYEDNHLWATFTTILQGIFIFCFLSLMREISG